MNYFNNGYPANYQPMPSLVPQAAAQQQPQVQQTQFSNGGNFFYVSNKNEVDNWIVNQGQTVYLFDTSNSVFYVKSVAKNGLPLPLETYEYHKQVENQEPEEVVEYVTKDEFNKMQSKFKAEIKKLKPLNRKDESSE